MSPAETSRLPADFGFGEDEALLRDLARRFLDEQVPVERLRKLVAAAPEPIYEAGGLPAWDPGLWKQMVELGWSGLVAPAGEDEPAVRLAGVAALLEEVGRHALPSPLSATLSVAFVLREAGGAVATRLLGDVAAGSAASLAITDARGSFDPRDCDVCATRDGDALVLGGNAHFVQDAFKADALLVSARLGDALALCWVPVQAPGLTLAQDHIHDLTRDQAHARLEGVRVPADAVVGEEGGAVLARAWPALLLVVAADLCGTAEWQLQTTVEYARTRTQFDRPIGFFQAVKHPLVDAMVRIDRARSLLYHAAACIEAGHPDAEKAARMAKSAASDAGAYVSDRSVQLHGGIGFTWECDVHVYFKRSLHAQAWLGDGVEQRARLAEILIGPVGPA